MDYISSEPMYEAKITEALVVDAQEYAVSSDHSALWVTYNTLTTGNTPVHQEKFGQTLIRNWEKSPSLISKRFMGNVYVYVVENLLEPPLEA